MGLSLFRMFIGGQLSRLMKSRGVADHLQLGAGEDAGVWVYKRRATPTVLTSAIAIPLKPLS